MNLKKLFMFIKLLESLISSKVGLFLAGVAYSLKILSNCVFIAVISTSYDFYLGAYLSGLSSNYLY